MRLFRKRPRLLQIDEHEAYRHSYGEPSGEVRVVKVEPKRPRYQLRVTGEALRRAFAERLDRRDHDH